MSVKRVVRAVVCAAVLLLLAVAGASPAFAGEAAWWYLDFAAQPSHLQPGGEGVIVVTAADLGDESVNASRLGSAVEITDKLPAGMTATRIVGLGGDCSPLPASTVTCMWEGPEALVPYEELRIEITVKVAEDARSGEENEVSVNGGEAYQCRKVGGGGKFTGSFCRLSTGYSFSEMSATDTGEFEGEFGGAVPAASYRRPVTVEGGVTPFGIEELRQVPEAENGTIDTQAGSHPFQFTTTLALNAEAELNHPPALVKDVRVKLPPGLVGNPTPLPQCSSVDFSALAAGANLCPLDTVIGAAATALSPEGSQRVVYVTPIFNLVPTEGEPARFGYLVHGVPVLLDTSVRSGGDYGVTVSVNNISELAPLLSSRVTFWGVPGDHRHDLSRGAACLVNGFFFEEAGNHCAYLEDPIPVPFLSLPTACTGPLVTPVEVDSWKEPHNVSFAEYTLENSSGTQLGLSGCNRLPFTPSLTDTPDGQAGSTPTGLTVDVHVPQEAVLNPTSLSQAAVRNTTVTLPEGVALNPAGADGLEACSEGQIGFLGKDSAGLELFTPTVGEPAAFCPNASKIGTVTIKTPLLPNALEGAVYLAAQSSNPFGSLVAMYLVAEDPVSGTLIKVAGEVALNQSTGQVVATFLNTPDLPFEDLALHFFGGERAPLATPAHCGGYTTTAAISPWSGNAPAQLSSEFDVTSGPDGAPCASPLPFLPSLTAGTTSIQAGGFSPFTMTMSRVDGSQNLQGIRLHMPPGLSGTLSTVKLCGEAQADAGTCGAESLIGETTVSVGLGGDPYSVTGGRVYITGPYRGAPFGLSIVVPAKAGPYNFGNVVVRAKLEVNEETAELTVTTDDEGPYKIPTILEGIPLEIKHVNVDINRPGFVFNATNCSPLQITGALTSTEGATENLSVPYQVTNCAVLAFKPKLEASTSGKTSRARGASLHVKLGYPAGPYDANISRVKVELPKALPSRLTTLQKACAAAVFDANPAACPPASIVGHATASTPVLPVPLEGPAYFVSHGGEAFPSLIIVLQGYGVTVHLVGSTFIDRAGITSSTFKTVPDVPVGTFELTLPQGSYSALAASGNFCKTKLAMPTEFIGQNGALIKTSTKIAVTGCGKAKQLHKKPARRKTHRKKDKRKRG